MLKTFSMDAENVLWIETSAKACGTKASTYLNQIVRHARGEMSVFGPPGKLKEKIEEHVKAETKKTQTTEERYWEDVAKSYCKDTWGPSVFHTWATDVRVNKYGLDQITGADVVEFIEKRKKE